MSHFKDSRGMVEKTGLGVTVMSAASAKTVLDISQGFGAILGELLNIVFGAFHRRAGLAYAVPAYLILAVSIVGLLDVFSGKSQISDQMVAVYVVALLSVNSFYAIAQNAFRIERVYTRLTQGYAFAWFGGSVLVFGGLFIGQATGLISLQNASPEAIVIGGFMLFNLFPKFLYFFVREIRCEEVIVELANDDLNLNVSAEDDANKVEKIWSDVKKKIKLKPLWMPTWMNLVTFPLIMGVITKA